ncbi:MAG: BMP family ABC transporter substrate-binding protein [Acidobacteriota bacterium]
MGVNPFLIMGQAGIERAAEQHGARTLVLESEDPTTRDENVRAAIAEGAELVLVLGFEFGDIIPRAARAHPEVEFLIADQCIDDLPENVHCAVFKEYESAFLIGAAAASLSKTRHVGVIGALDIPFLHRYTEGFTLGAQHVDPEIRVSILWVGGESPFSDPVRAKEQALAMAASGADYILSAAAAGNFGIFEAAQEQGFGTFGIDVNQCPSAPEVVFENMIKRVDVAIGEAIEAILAGQPGQIHQYGLAQRGVGLVTLTSDRPQDSQCRILEHPELLDQLRDLEHRIIGGEISIRDPMFTQGRGD